MSFVSNSSNIFYNFLRMNKYSGIFCRYARNYIEALREALRLMDDGSETSTAEASEQGPDYSLTQDPNYTPAYQTYQLTESDNQTPAFKPEPAWQYSGVSSCSQYSPQYSPQLQFSSSYTPYSSPPSSHNTVEYYSDTPMCSPQSITEYGKLCDVAEFHPSYAPPSYPNLY